jgi:hypothetical protein
VPESNGNVPGPVEIEDNGTLLHPPSGPALIEVVKRNQFKYFLTFRIGKSDANFCFNLNGVTS